MIIENYIKLECIIYGSKERRVHIVSFILGFLINWYACIKLYFFYKCNRKNVDFKKFSEYNKTLISFINNEINGINIISKSTPSIYVFL